MRISEFFRGRTLLSRFLFSFLAVILLTILALSIATSLLFANYFYAAKEQELARKGQEMARLIESVPLASLASFVDAQVLLVDRDGMVRAITPGIAGGVRRRFNAPPTPSQVFFQLDPAETKRLLAGETLTGRGYDPRLERAVVSATVPFRDADGEVAGALLLFAPVSDLAATVVTVRRITLYAGGFSVVLAVMLGYFLSRSLSRPLQEINRASLAMAAGDYSQRVTVAGPAEVEQLATSINLLAAGLDQSVNALAREKEKLADILARMTEGVVAVNRDGRVILSNDSARDILQTNIKEGTLLETSCPELDALLKAILAGGSPAADELRTKDEQSVLRATAAPLLEDGGQASGAVAVIRDVTEQHHLEQMRRDFVANVSHELRTPLTSVQGVLEAIQDGLLKDPGEQARYVSMAHRETLRLKRLINDLLDLSRMDAGRVSWEINAVDLADLADRAATQLRPQAEKRGVSLDVQAPKDLPPALGNEDRTAQVLTNLLENAVRVSPSGERVLVTVTEKEGRLLVQVADKGPGVPAADLPHIWERFYRVEKSRSRDSGGTGLGLAIARQIVEAQGGQVDAASHPGGGTVFSFTIPAAPAEETQSDK